MNIFNSYSWISQLRRQRTSMVCTVRLKNICPDLRQFINYLSGTAMRELLAASQHTSGDSIDTWCLHCKGAVLCCSSAGLDEIKAGLKPIDLDSKKETTRVRFERTRLAAEHLV